MRVLVTGAVGRLGRHTVEALHRAGLDVRATDSRFIGGLPVKLDLADLLDEYTAYRLAEGCDAVVHLANHPSMMHGVARQRIYRENTAMTANVLTAAVDLGIKRIVYASTIQVICGDRTVGQADRRPSVLPYLPMDGELPRQPGNEYALSKAAGEELVEHLCRKDSALSATAVRFPGLWEADWRHWRVPRQRRGGWGGEHHHADEGFLFLLQADAARLILAILQRQGPGYHQMMPASARSTVDYPVHEIVQRFYADVPRKFPGRPLTSLVDTSAITTALGWEPTPEPEVEPVAAPVAV